MRHRVLFANMSYRFNGELQGYFRYVRETGDACEKYNFNPINVDGKSVCQGFFEAGYTKGGYKYGSSRQVHIERIDNVFKNANSAIGVTVVWCSLINTKGTKIVGWYKNAEVFRRVLKLPFGAFEGRGNPEYGYVYNVVAEENNCVSLPPSEISNPEWRAPRYNKDGYGFGQRNMWYAKEPEAKEYVENILNKISHYSGENLIS
jgi:hypothetical protein